MVSKLHGRAAAWTAAAILTVTAGLEVYWDLGGTWALPPGEAPVSTPDLVAAVIVGLVGLWFAVVLLIRVGYWPKLAQFALARINAWVIVVLVLGGAIREFAAQEFVGGTINLIIALLAFVVARSEVPASPTSGAAPTPGGKPGPPTPAH